MGLYKHVRLLWRKPQKNMPDLWRERLITWRKESSTVTLEHPTRIDRARSLGYKAKQGFVVARQRVARGDHVRPQFKGGRRPKRSGTKMNLKKNYQQISFLMIQRTLSTTPVSNSYW